MLKEATLVRPLKKRFVQCTACEHFCAIPPDGAGKCGVRRNIDGTLNLVVYADPAAVHVDPIEKKPMFHLLPGRTILSLGTLGCNFTCAFCQNWDISQRGAEADWRRSHRRVMPADLVDRCVREGIPLLAYTYNEPTVFFEYAFDTCKLAHERGVRNVFVSSGFESQLALDAIEPYLDGINVDLKAFTETFYRDVCGTRLKPVIRNIEHIAKRARIWIEITTLLIPGLNDGDAELKDMAAWLASVSPDMPWHLSAFHPDYRMLDRPPTPHRALMRAYDIGKAAGLRYVYLGNVRDVERSSTACPGCGARLVTRAWYDTRTHWREPGVCHSCGARIPGVWR